LCVRVHVCVGCISVRQPFAFSLVRGGKDCENRDWKKILKEGGVWWAVQISTNPTFLNDTKIKEQCEALNGTKLTRVEYEKNMGKVIGAVQVLHRVPGEECDSPWSGFPKKFRYAYTIGKKIVFKKPIKQKGQVGYFIANDEVARAIDRHLRQNKRK